MENSSVSQRGGPAPAPQPASGRRPRHHGRQARSGDVAGVRGVSPRPGSPLASGDGDYITTPHPPGGAPRRPHLRPASSSAQRPGSSCSRQHSPALACGPKLRQWTVGSSSAGFSLAVCSVASTSARFRMAPAELDPLRKPRHSVPRPAQAVPGAAREAGRRAPAGLILWLAATRPVVASGAGGNASGFQRGLALLSSSWFPPGEARLPGLQLHLRSDARQTYRFLSGCTGARHAITSFYMPIKCHKNPQNALNKIYI